MRTVEKLKEQWHRSPRIVEKEPALFKENKFIPIVYPFLISVIPILHLYASNSETPFSIVLWPLLISLGFTLTAFVVLRLILKNSDASGLILSLFLILLFSFGLLDGSSFFISLRGMHLLILMFYVVIMAVGLLILHKFRSRMRTSIYRTAIALFLCVSVIGALLAYTYTYLPYSYLLSILFATICIIFAVGVFFLARHRTRLRNISVVMSVTTGVLAAMILVNLFVNLSSANDYKIANDSKIRPDDMGKAAASGDVVPGDPAELPDIYYIILDSYGGEGILRERFGFDNSEFIAWLESRGFYVADKSRSNYSMTVLSLPSSLNSSYLNYLSDMVGEKSTDIQPLIRHTEDNSLMRFLKAMGYKFVFFGSSFDVTEHNRYADIAHTFPWTNREFFVALMKSTGLRHVYQPKIATRKIVLSIFADIPGVRKEVEGPLFLFAHIIPPHEPYLFDRNGKPLKKTDDKDEAYIEQLMFVNKEVKKMVTGILSVSERPPVIVIQGDHGPSDAYESYEVEILNAYLIPGGDELLYSNITPVNSFRVILNRIFGAELPLLQDKTYVSGLTCPYFFRELEPISPE